MKRSSGWFNRLMSGFEDPFWIGVASVLDLGGALHQSRLEKILQQNNEEALRSGWEAVGDAIRSVLPGDDNVYPPQGPER